MKLIVISSKTGSEEETRSVNQLFEEGLTHFHLRKPSWTIDEMRRYLDKVEPSFYSRVVLHDHYELVQEFGLKGVNLNERHHDYYDEITSQNIQKSASAHSFIFVDAFSIAKFDYVFLSPIFDSISKPGYSATFNEEELRLFLEKTRETEVIALGGVNTENISKSKELGFEGVAVLGAVWNSHQPLESFKQLNKLCQTSAILS